MNKTRFLTASLSGLVLCSLAGATQAESLADVYQQALASAPQLRSAQASFEAAQEAIPQAKSNFFPSLNAGASHTENLKDDYVDYQTYSLSLNQVLYNRSLGFARDTAESSVAQASAEYDVAGLQLIFDVANAYFSVLASQDNLDFAIAEREANARQLEQTQQRFEVGLVAITDVNESQAAFDSSVASVIEAENLLTNSREDVRVLTGQYMQDPRTLSEDLPLVKPDPDSLEAWTTMALEQNPNLLAAQASTQQAEYNIETQQSSKYPTAGLNVTHREIEGYDTTDGTTAVISLNYNFYEGGAKSSRISQARALKRQSEEIYEQLKRNTESQVRNAYRGVITDISRVRALNQAVISAQSALRAAEAGYEVGTRTTVDVLAARRNVFDAQRNLARARYNYILNTLTLRQAAGVLSEADLAALDKWLE